MTTSGPELLRLGNGLRVVLLHRPGAAGTHVVTHVGAGYRFDPPGRPGLAHLVEHLFTQDSGEPVTARALTTAQAYGGASGAVTHADYTEFHHTFPSPLLPAFLAWEAERLAGPRFTPAHLARQLAGVHEEIARRRTGTRWGLFPWPALPCHLYDDFALGHDGLGVPEALHDVSFAEAVSFFTGHYVPSNTVLTLAGDLGGRGGAGLERLLESTLGGVPARGGARERPPRARPLRRDRRGTVALPAADRAAVAFGYAVDGPRADPAAYAAAVVTARCVLSLDRHGRPPDGDHLVSAACGFFGPCDSPDHDTLFFVGTPRDSGSRDLAARLDDALASLAADPSAAVVRAARTRAVADRVRDGETAMDRARWAGRGTLLFDDAWLLDRFVTALGEVTPAAVREAAHRLVSAPRATLHGTPGPDADRPAGPPPPPARQQPRPVPAASAPHPVFGRLTAPPLSLPVLRDSSSGTGRVVVVQGHGPQVSVRVIVPACGLGVLARTGFERAVRSALRGMRVAPERTTWIGDRLIVAARVPAAGPHRWEDVPAGLAELREQALAQDASGDRARAALPPAVLARELASGPDDRAGRSGSVPAPAVVLVTGPEGGGGRAAPESVRPRPAPVPLPAGQAPPARPGPDGPRAPRVLLRVVPDCASAAFSLLPRRKETAPAVAAQHLAVAVLAGVGRLPLGRRGRLADLRNGTVAAGLEPALGGTRAFLSGTCEPGRSGHLLRETMEALSACADGLTAAETEAAAEFCAGQWGLALDEDATTADLVAQQIAFGRGLAEIEVFPARLREVTAQDVSAALGCLFAPDRMRGGVVDVRAPEGLPSAWAVDGETVHP
ncbi:hypothetical protein GTU99_25375 [Streptomyces sp. PRKS01-65]|nr:insulinase family protein [Streptomyces harenosi]NEY35462.1 hypothetical protein [Streptomyces harenosi]